MKDIKGFEGLYAVTSCGKVWSYKAHKFLSPGKTQDGYLQVVLRKDNESKHLYVHRLVAQAYIPNEDNLETVDHIDCDKTNNNVNNLHWLSRSDNAKRYWKEWREKHA